LSQVFYELSVFFIRLLFRGPLPLRSRPTPMFFLFPSEVLARLVFSSGTVVLFPVFPLRRSGRCISQFFLLFPFLDTTNSVFGAAALDYLFSIYRLFISLLGGPFLLVQTSSVFLCQASMDRSLLLFSMIRSGIQASYPPFLLLSPSLACMVYVHGTSLFFFSERFLSIFCFPFAVDFSLAMAPFFFPFFQRGRFGLRLRFHVSDFFYPFLSSFSGRAIPHPL